MVGIAQLCHNNFHVVLNRRFRDANIFYHARVAITVKRVLKSIANFEILFIKMLFLI